MIQQQKPLQRIIEIKAHGIPFRLGSPFEGPWNRSNVFRLFRLELKLTYKKNSKMRNPKGFMLPFVPSKIAARCCWEIVMAMFFVPPDAI